jgi:tRNA G18 (ribose-2'-O)-methylase SpoU
MQKKHRVVPVHDLQHEMLEPYRDMRSRNWIFQSGIFIAEGPLLVERLLSSAYSVESILLDEKFADHYLHLIPDSIPILLIPHEMVPELVGFNFHRGVLACGRRQPLRYLTDACPITDLQEIWLALVGVQDPENVGGILRSASGLGISNVFIGPGTADPLSRRALRVSMGNILRLRIHHGSDVVAGIRHLKQMGLECVATTLDEHAEVLESSKRNGPIILFLGNERHGLPEYWVKQMDRSISIPMALNTDSLNVSVAAGIVMHYFSRLCPARR